MNPHLLELLHGAKDHYPHSLERQFPHILNKIIELWGTPALDPYIQSLLIDDRGDRHGFPHWVASEIFQLNRIHDQQIQPSEGADDLWESAAPASQEMLERGGVTFQLHSMMDAAAADEFDTVHLLLQRGEAVDCRDDRSWTPLIAAAFNGHPRTALLLLEYGAAIDAQDKSGYSALHWAAYNGQTKLVRILLEAHANPNLASESGTTPLMQAAGHGHLAVAELLLSSEADLAARNHLGWTALHKAAAQGQLTIAQFLISRGLEDSPTLDGQTAAALAEQHGHGEIAAFLRGG